jgi:hypothetical protein
MPDSSRALSLCFWKTFSLTNQSGQSTNHDRQKQEAIRASEQLVMAKKIETCGNCGWMRKGVCHNPKSPNVDKHLGTKAPACALIYKA